ncbi:MAG: putative toxin-antitoxin system toxin component, PIN family [Desulfobacterales bacterium]|nr:putative toxin-antitoxin system toxin component, PIN family [Desulfobacterales bacterium]
MAKKQNIRAVLDTNLFVSGLFSSYGSVAKLQQFWLSGAFELAVSEEILQEIGETLQKSYIQKQLHLKPEEIYGILELIREKAFVVTKDHYKTDRITDDPDDNKFLGCALEAKAYYVVSGDNHLLSLKHFHGIQIVDAKTFVREMERKTTR